MELDYVLSDVRGAPHKLLLCIICSGRRHNPAASLFLASRVRSTVERLLVREIVVAVVRTEGGGISHDPRVSQIIEEGRALIILLI